MPGLHWPFVLAPLPPRRKKRVQPGFTDEELLYLEEILALIDSMHDPDDTQAHDLEPQLANHHAPALAPARPTPSRSPSSSSLASTSSSQATATTQRLAVHSLRSHATEANLWAFVHPSTLGIFLVFLATLLLSHSSQSFVSVSGLLGAGCLAFGLKILIASEDQALRPNREHEEAVVGNDRGRARGRGRRSRRHTTSS